MKKLTYKEIEEKEMEVYQRLCSGCTYEIYCHENCETCEEYDDAIYKIEFEEEE